MPQDLSALAARYGPPSGLLFEPFSSERFKADEPFLVDEDEFDLLPQPFNPYRPTYTNKGQPPIGLRESISRTNIFEKIPFSPVRAWRTGRLFFAAKRWNKDEYTSDADRIADETMLTNYLDEIQEREGRGLTFWAQVYDGASEMPAWMIEFWLTASFVTTAKKATMRAAGRIAGKAARKGLARTLTKGLGKVAGAAAGAGTRAFAMPHRVAEAGFRRQGVTAWEFTPEGRLIVELANEKPATAWMKAYAEVVIQAFSEEAGAAITKGITAPISRIPGAKPLFSRIAKGLKRIAPPERIAKAITKSGYSSFIGEMGEEQLERVLLAATGLDNQDWDNTTFFERLMETVPTGEEFRVQATVLSLPMAGRTGIGFAANSFTRSNIGSEGLIEPPIEADEPFLLDEDEFEEDTPEGFAFDPTLKTEAHADTPDVITVGPTFFDLPSPEAKKAVVRSLTKEIEEVTEEGEPIPQVPIVPVIDPITGVDLGPLTRMRITAATFGDSAKKLFTRHVDLEAEVRQTLIEHEEQMIYLPKKAAQRVAELFVGTSKADRRAIQLSLDHPAKFPLENLPAKLQSVAEQVQRDSAEALKIHQSVGHLTDGGWPGGRIVHLQKQLDKLQSADREPGQQFQHDTDLPEHKKDIEKLKQQIKEMEDYGYVHRISRQPRLVKQALNRIVGRLRGRSFSTKPKALLGTRFYPTIEEAEKAGFEVANIVESHADMLALTWIAQANNNFIEALTKNPDIALPKEEAPADWINLGKFTDKQGNKIFPAGKGLRFAPPIADAIQELVTTPDDRLVLTRWYDNLNFAFKIVGFYNPLIMTKNDLFQGWRAAGLKFFVNIPKATKIWVKKGKIYHTFRKEGLFSTILDLNPGASELAQDLLDELELTTGQKVRKALERYVHPLHPLRDIQRINRITTWNIDEILRIATVISLQDGRLAQQYGMTHFELTELANDFMANYGKVPKHTRTVMNRFFFTPTYRISMKRIMGKILLQPKKYWPQLTRHYGYKLFVWYVLPNLIAMAVAATTGRSVRGRPERGYRIILRGVVPGREIVVSLSDPLLEEAKLLGQPILQHAEYQLAAMPNLLMNLFRGPRWKKENDLYGHLFKLGTPFWRDIKLLLDEDASLAQKILQPLGIAFIYSRRAQRGDEENAARNLARALSIWGNAKEQIEDLRTKGLIKEKSR